MRPAILATLLMFNASAYGKGTTPQPETLIFTPDAYDHCEMVAKMYGKHHHDNYSEEMIACMQSYDSVSVRPKAKPSTQMVSIESSQ